MGVKGLTNLLRRFAPGSVVLRHPQDYRKKRIAIDASLYLNKFMFGKELEDIPNQHIAGFYSLTSFCSYYEIEPVFVFDGDTRSALKKRELERRKLLKAKVVSSLAFEKERMVRIKSISKILLKNDHIIQSNLRQHVLSVLESHENTIDHRVHIPVHVPVQPDKIHSKENILVPTSSLDDDHEAHVSVHVPVQPDIAHSKESTLALEDESQAYLPVQPDEIYSKRSILAPEDEFQTHVPVLEHIQQDKIHSKENILVPTSSLKDDHEVHAHVPVQPDIAHSKESTLALEDESQAHLPVQPDEIYSKRSILAPEDEFQTHVPVLEPIQQDKIHSEVSASSLEDESLGEIIQILPALVQEIQRSKIIAEDKTKYTQTIRDMMTREYSLLKIFAEGHDIKQALEDFTMDSYNHVAALENRAIIITPELRKESAAFLKAIGYPVFVCENHEAEAMCAQMATLGFVDYINSDDLDVCAFGDKPLLRHFSMKDKMIMEIDPSRARAELGISKESFIDLCILCGTDFSSTIPNVGPIRGLSLIKKHTSIENIINDQQKYQPGENFTYEEARDVFTNPPSVEQDENLYKYREPDESIDELMQYFRLSAEEMQIKLDLLDKDLRSMQYQSGEHAFGPDPFKEMETL